MSWVAAAIGGSALLGAGMSYSAASQQADAANNALDFQKQAYAQNRKDSEPFIGAGKDALGRLNESYLNPSSFLNTPDYQFGKREGMGALENSAAARGGMLGGNFLRRADQFGTDYATNYLTQYRAGNAGIANMGANAASGASNAANTSAGQIGNTMNYLGGANASGGVGAANALTGGVQNYMLMNALNKSSYGGSGSPISNVYGAAGDYGVPTAG